MLETSTWIEPGHSTTKSTIASATPILAGVVARIRELELMPSGWDGVGGPPIQIAAVRKAIHLLGSLRAEQLPEVIVAPVTGGGLQLEWRRPGREAEIEILPDGSVEYLTDQAGKLDANPIPKECETAEVMRIVDWVIG